MKTSNPKCQSCGMPLKRDEQGGGTNADGSRNTTYCSHCYQSGGFVVPGMTVEQMQTLVGEKLVGIGFPRFVTGMFTRRIPRLERWRASARTHESGEP